MSTSLLSVSLLLCFIAHGLCEAEETESMTHSTVQENSLASQVLHLKRKRSQRRSIMSLNGPWQFIGHFNN